jgi:hypothetical protein
MKASVFLLISLLLVPDPVSAAWLLWQHWIAGSRVASREKENPNKWKRTNDSWKVDGGFDTRDRCIAELPKRADRFKATIDSLYKAGDKNAAKVDRGFLNADGISWTVTEVVTTPEHDDKPAEENLIYNKYWCLPSDTDPKNIGDDAW